MSTTSGVFAWLGIALALALPFRGQVPGDTAGGNGTAPAANSPTAATQAANGPSLTDLAGAYFTAPTGQPPKQCVDDVLAAVATSRTRHSAVPMRNILSVGTEPLCVDWLILSSNQYQKARSADVQPLVAQAEKAAIAQVKTYAQQEGSNSGSGGSTSLTAKGLSSKILSIATEYGALTQSTSQQTTTASGSFGGVPAALHHQGYFSECTTRILAMTPCLRSGFLDQMSRISYSISFPAGATSSTTVATPMGTATGTAQAVTTTSQDNSVSAFGLKWVIIQAPLSQTAVTAALKTIGQDPSLSVVGKASAALFDMEANSPAYQAWLSAEADALTALAALDASGQSTLDQWKTLGTALVSAMDGVAAHPDGTVSSSLGSNAASLAVAYNKYLGAEELATLTQRLAQPPILSVEYDDNRPTGQPSNSVVRAIFQKTVSMKDKSKVPIVIVTVNGAVSFYNSNQSDVPGAGYLRDVQVAGEVGHDFSVNSSLTGQLNFTLSTAGYFQYQSSPSILNVTPGAPVDGVTFVGLSSTATKAFANTGNLGLWQLKVTTGSGSAVKVPLSVTYSNKTELIAKPTWKAQIGVSYDFDSLFGSK